MDFPILITCIRDCNPSPIIIIIVEQCLFPLHVPVQTHEIYFFIFLFKDKHLELVFGNVSLKN